MLLRKKLIGGGGNPSTNNFDFETSGDYKKGVKVVRNYGPKKDNLSFSASGLLSQASILGTSSGNYFDADGATYSSFFKPKVKEIGKRRTSANALRYKVVTEAFNGFKELKVMISQNCMNLKRRILILRK